MDTWDLRKLGDFEMKLTTDTIQRLKNNLSITTDCHILMIRGCSCSSYGEWQEELIIKKEKIDHQSMNCVFVILHPYDSSFLMPLKGSTTPHAKYLNLALARGGNGANQLELGFYRGYEKGLHYPSKETAHFALRQTNPQPVRRTKDNLSFDLEDRIEVGNFNDNIHAAWNSYLGAKTHASGGCLVIAGYPDCQRRTGNTLHWKIFYDTIYAQTQQSFNVLLVSYDWVSKTVNNTMKKLIVFGSDEDNVKAIQSKLVVNESFCGPKTYKAILDYQRENGLVVDGIVGPQTLKKMGIK